MKWFVIAMLAACGGNRVLPEPAPAPEPAEPAIARELAPSIYDLPIELRTASGTTEPLGVTRGQPTLVAMFYASCPVACPVLIEEIRQTARELGDPADLRILLVSFDAARDTPAKLRELARERRLDDRWILASASDPDARALAAVLGVKFRKLDSGEFFHGATIVALDREGRPVGRTDAIGKREGLVAALR
jgi:protein SCO1/2